MISKTKLSLQATEAIVFQVAGGIYTAYLSSGKVTEGDEQKWMERALRETLQLVTIVDARVQSDNELD